MKKTVISAFFAAMMLAGSMSLAQAQGSINLCDDQAISQVVNGDNCKEKKASCDKKKSEKKEECDREKE